MHPSPINSRSASYVLSSSLSRHAQLLKADQSPEDKDSRPGHVNIGENGSEWRATVSGDEKGGSYSFTQPGDEAPSDTVTLNSSSLVKMQTYRNYDGKEYMTTTHVDRTNLDNSFQVTRVIDKESVWG